MSLQRALAVFAFIYVLCPALGFAASFDCKKAATAFEKAVCADPETSKFDEQMSDGYKKAMGILSEDGKKFLQDGQKAWLRFANDICLKYKTNREMPRCLRNLYEKRVKDMQTAAVKIGPYTFSRIDYFYSKDDSDFGRPYEGQSSYARIDNPISDAEKKWNALMGPKKPEAEGDEWCDGAPGDVEVGFEIGSATSTSISASTSSWMYCHGAAHGYGGDENNATYIMTPSLHKLTVADMFSANSGWQDFLTQRCYDGIIEHVKERFDGDISGVNLDKRRVKNVVIRPSSWSITPEGLVIEFAPYSVLAYVYGTAVVTIPWVDLKPYLATSAPIPQ